jgi:hypothetical protein
MTIALADVRTLAFILPLLATCACGADPAQPPQGAAGSAGNSLGGIGTGGTSGGGGANGGTANGGTANGGTANGGTANGGTANGGTATAGAAGMSGSSGGFGVGGAPPGTPTFSQVTAIIQANCGSKCHSGEREDIINLTGTSDTLYARLTSPLDTDLCYRVVPVQRGSAATSLLARVLKAEITAPCPLPRMPAGCAGTNECLGAADIATIDGWINAGAYKN